MESKSSQSKSFKKKSIQVFVESNIEFTIDITDKHFTCGLLLTEVVRKYYEKLE